MAWAGALTLQLQVTQTINQGITFPIPVPQPHGILCFTFSALDHEVEQQKLPPASCVHHLLRQKKPHDWA